ncbi:MAG: carbohydrate porin [Verrucomicrobia bacterium]|nr:carbohydrate porin [Verrucomicrobiota bacterium]
MKTQTRTILIPILSVLIVGYCTFKCSAESPQALQFPTLIHLINDPKGVTLTGEYIGEGLGNLSGGIQQGAIYEGLLKFTLGLDLEKIFCWDGASLYASTLYPHGNGLSRQYTGDLNILSNIDAYDSFRLFELWFQKKFFGDKASIRIGQLSADVEFYQSQWSNLFINSCFGTFPTIAFGTLLPIYPVGGLGARIELHPGPSTFLRTAVFDSNPGMQDTDDKHGARFHLNPSAGVIVLSEAAYQITPSVENGGKEESYIIGGYYDSRRFTANFLEPTHASNGGLYAIADRILYRKTPYVNEQSSFSGLGGFTSMGVAPADRNLISFYADCGINYNGLFPARDNDVFGIALSYAKISRDYLVNNVPVHSGHETVLEATYRFQVNERVYIQPDFQYIFDPGAFRHLPNAFVAGVRYDLTF